MKLIVQKGYISQRNGNKVTIFDSENSQLLSFNTTATFIFDQLKKGLDSNQVALELARKYEITEVNAKKDVSEFTELLLAKGLAKKETLSK